MNIAFSMKARQVHQRLATVTRRLGWDNLQVGSVLTAIEKGQGLKAGEKVVRLGRILVVRVSRERVNAITYEDVLREGFQDRTTEEFIESFCQGHDCRPSDMCTRIEFVPLDEKLPSNLPRGHADEYWRHAKVVSVYDGDTFRADIDLGFGVWAHNQSFRLARVNTPELRGKDGVPAGPKGKEVRDKVRGWILEKPVILQSIKTGKYGRWLAEVEVEIDGHIRNLSDYLIRKNLGEKYKG